MDEHISALNEAQQSFNEALKAVEDPKLAVKLVHDRLFSELKKALEFLTTKAQQLAEQYAALEKRSLNWDVAGQDRLKQDQKDINELDESIQAVSKGMAALDQYFKDQKSLLAYCLDQSEPDPKKNP